MVRILLTGCGCTFRKMVQNYMLHMIVEATKRTTKQIYCVTVAATRARLAEVSRG